MGQIPQRVVPRNPYASQLSTVIGFGNSPFLKIDNKQEVINRLIGPGFLSLFHCS
jgi:hypothetical protein